MIYINLAWYLTVVVRDVHSNEEVPPQSLPFLILSNTTVMTTRECHNIATVVIRIILNAINSGITK